MPLFLLWKRGCGRRIGSLGGTRIPSKENGRAGGRITPKKQKVFSVAGRDCVGAERLGVLAICARTPIGGQKFVRIAWSARDILFDSAADAGFVEGDENQVVGVLFPDFPLLGQPVLKENG